MFENIIIQSIDRQRPILEEISGKIWENPELGFEEYKASGWVADELERNGFRVERGVVSIPTAIKASFGQGHPVIGLLGEYDSLPNLSQKTQATREPVKEGAPGHGCGHNLLGVAHMGAAIAIKEALEASGLPGTIIFYGCPAEEGGSAKSYMARDGAFSELDLSIHFHPGNVNTVGISGTAICQGKFHFHGVTAHPAVNPQEGRNALEAVELMNVGASFLREHVGKDVSIAYIITDGGKAPNMIPDAASVWYNLRADDRDQLMQVYERVRQIAAGAATMSGTTVAEEFLGCVYNPLNNRELMRVVEKAFDAIPAEPYTDDEIAYISALNEANPRTWERNCKQYHLPPKTPYLTDVLPLFYNRGSTDVGDVNHVCPGVSFRTMCYPMGVQAHTWAATAITNHSFAKKGMIRGSKIIAWTAMQIFQDPSICDRAKAEFQEVTHGKPYQACLPDTPPANIF